MATAALQAGKHVYCEKPAGIDSESIARLLKVGRASDRVFQIGQQMRSFSFIREAIQKVHEGVAGDVVMVKAQRHASWDLDHNSSSADWFFNAKRSGDVIVEMAWPTISIFAIGPSTAGRSARRASAEISSGKTRSPGPYQHGRLRAELRLR